MENLFRFFANNKIIATLFSLSLVLLGIKTTLQVSRSEFPDVHIGEFAINTFYPGASPEDVELNITNKIERQLNSVRGIKKVESFSMENNSSIQVYLKSNIKDIDKVKIEIHDAISRITDFPPEVREPPSIKEIKTSEFPILELGISGDIPYPELRRIAKNFQKRLKSISSIANLKKYGYRAREIKIEIIPDKIKQYQVSMSKLIDAIQNRNIKSSGGTLESFTSERNVVTLAQFESPIEVGDVIIHSASDGVHLKISDLAIINDGFEEPRVFSRISGKKTISFVISKTASGDIIRTVKAIKRLAQDEEKKYNGRIQFLYTDDKSLAVKNQFSVVLKNGIMGLVFVLLILTFFLNFRTAFWVAACIPITVLGVIFLLPQFGIGLDSITLASMVLIIGIIVDDGIIISENIFRRRELGDEPVEAIAKGMKEVYMPVLATILTTFFAFAPMFFIPGMIGKFIFVIPLTISLSLFISLGECTIALPAHLIPGLKGYQYEHQSNKSYKMFIHLKKWFGKVITLTLKYRYMLMAIAVILLVFSLLYGIFKIKISLFPAKGAETFTIKAKLPIGSSLENTSEKIKEIEQIINSLPRDELLSYGVKIGGGNGEHRSLFTIQLTSFTSRQRTAHEIVESLRKKTDQLIGYKDIIYRIKSRGPSDDGAVEINVIGSHKDKRKKLAESITKYLKGLNGVKDVQRSDLNGKDQVEIKLHYEMLARLGLTVNDIAQNVRIAFDGHIATNVRYDDEDINYRVQLEKEYRKNLDYLKRLLIPNENGELIPLQQVAELQFSQGPSGIQHYNGTRVITITTDLNKEVTTALEIEGKVNEKFHHENNLSEAQLFFGGEVEETNEVLINIIFIAIIALISIYFLLSLLFNSFFQPIIVMVSIPFGIISVIFTLIIHNEPITLMVLVGAIGLSGIIVNDALVLVDHLNYLRRKDPNKSTINIIAQGTLDRVRPILLTTISTVAGMIPLAYGFGGTDIYMAPMALTLGYGLFFATPLTILLLPSLYMMGEDVKLKFTH